MQWSKTYVSLNLDIIFCDHVKIFVESTLLTFEFIMDRYRTQLIIKTHIQWYCSIAIDFQKLSETFYKLSFYNVDLFLAGFSTKN